jgi:hypothetical protein
MKKQTALQWLIEQVHSDEYTNAFGRTYISIDLIEQALEMEREQIMITASHSHFEGGNYKMSGLELFEYGFKYYNETYGN